jgi:hypothetical protein
LNPFADAVFGCGKLAAGKKRHARIAGHAMPDSFAPIRINGERAKCFAGMPNNRSQFELNQVETCTKL